MPRNTRDWALRELEYARTNINWCGTHVKRVLDRYNEKHPEIANPLGDSLDMCLLLDNLLETVHNSF